MTATDPKAWSKARVVAIDDSEDVHRLLTARLRQEDLELVSARDAEAGLHRVREAPTSLVLLDLDMPGMDGFEALRLLKESPQTVNVPVIVLSGIASAQDKVVAFDLGAHDYVTKPFDMTELRVRIRAALRLNFLVAMLAQRAQLDGLTGLWNRAYFDNRVQEEISRIQRHADPISMAFFDADHFKSINDTFGHPAGDVVLQGIARTLQSEIRQTDIACRYGGEEFVVIMPKTTVEEAKISCERIRGAIESINWARHPERKVTVSIGVAGSNGPSGLSAASLVEAADQCVYAAKSAGRNRVIARDLSTGAVPATAADLRRAS